MAQVKRKARGMPNSVGQGVRILGRVSGRPSLLYYSAKASGIIALESPAEKTVAQLADLDPRVVKLRAQPLTVDIVTGRLFHSHDELIAGREVREKPEVKIREYTPDFLLVLIDGTHMLVEVKNERYLGDEVYWQKVAQAEGVLRRNGYDFITITIPYRPDLPLVQNADLLTTYHANFMADVPACQLPTEENSFGTSVLQLGTLCTRLNMSLRQAPALVLSGTVGTDLRKVRLGAHSEIFLAKGNLSHLEMLPLAD